MHAGGASSYHGGGAYGYRGPSSYARVPYYGTARTGGYWNNGYRGWNNGYRGGNYWRGNGYWGNGWGWRGPWRSGYAPWGYGWGWGYPWWGGAYLGWGVYPGWGWYGNTGYYDSSYYDSYPTTYATQTYPSYVYVTPGSDDYSQSDTTTQQDEINRLNNEVDQLRSQQSSNWGPSTSTWGPGSKSATKAEVHAETVLIYRDGHAEEVDNYAIVGKTLWVFNQARAKKIPLTDLDLAATKRDNEDRGITFVVPASSR